MPHTTAEALTHRRPLFAALLVALTPALALAQTLPQPQSPPPPQVPGPLQPHHVRIRILNARTSQPVTDERLNVALRADQIGSVAMPTDKNGVILVDTGDATTIRVLSNFYADCRPRGELYTNYPLATISAQGLAATSLCRPVTGASPVKPGELLLFVIPKTYIPKAGEAPNTYLPHSDESPH